MSFYVVSHKVENFNQFKKVYDDFEPTREKYGVTEKILLQASDDADNVLVVGEGELDAIKKFVSCDELKEGMKKAGISSEPQLFIGEAVK